ncbi:Toxin coregulated pilus biosynthesis protein E [compost metagenome]
MAFSLQRFWLKLQFGAAQRIRVYQKLNRFLSSSVSLRQALEIMYQHASEDGRKPKNPTAVILLQWLRSVKNGQSFGQAIQGWVPDGDRLVIEGGEAAGNLPQSIERAVLISESLRLIVSTILGGIAYPVMLFLAAIGFLIFFGTTVIPQFEEILPREEWTGIAAQMSVMSDFVQYGMVWVLLALAALGILISATMTKWTGPIRKKFDKYPPWSLYRLVIGAGFMLTVSGMIRAGIAVPKILTMLQRGASPWYVEKLSKTLYQVKNGHNLGEALYRTGFNFPDKDTVADLRAYANLNKFDETLQRLGEEWLGDAIKRIKAQMAVLFMTCLLFFGGVFFWIAGGIFSLVNQVQAVAQ